MNTIDRANEYMQRAWQNIYNDAQKQRKTMNTQTLEQLVQDTVDTFIALGQSFSIYDITTNIRTLVNSGVVVPVNLPIFGGSYFISHSDVKTTFSDLVEDNGFSK